MKKAWIIAGGIILLVVVDVFLRMQDGAEPDSEPSTGARREMRQEGSGYIRSPDHPESQVVASEDRKSPLDSNAEMKIGQSYREECTDFFGRIRNKPVKELESKDFDFPGSLTNKEMKTSLIGSLHGYVACRALQLQDFSPCAVVDDLAGPEEAPFSCEMILRIFLPLRGRFTLHMEIEQFADLYEDLPAPDRDWMQAFFSIIDEGRPEDCKRIAEDSLILGLCRIAAGEKVEAPAEGEARDAYYTMLAMRTGQASYLAQVEPGLPRVLVRAAQGDEGACRAYLDQTEKTACSKGLH